MFYKNNMLKYTQFKKWEAFFLYSEYIILGVLLLLSYIGHNMSVFYAVGIILILKLFQFNASNELLSKLMV